MLIQACLNGTRPLNAHPALPWSPEEFAREAQRAVVAGAGALHLHPRDLEGNETFEADVVAQIVNAVRAACPGIPVGGTTGAWIVADVAERLRLIQSWRVVPDYVSVNFSEGGVVALSEALLAKGIGIEAGLSTPADAWLVIEHGLADKCVRILLEPNEGTVTGELALVHEIETILDTANVRAPRLLHGFDRTAWPLLHYALEHGYEIRIGLEDTLILPDESTAAHNGMLVAAARARV